MISAPAIKIDLRLNVNYSLMLGKETQKMLNDFQRTYSDTGTICTYALLISHNSKQSDNKDIF